MNKILAVILGVLTCLGGVCCMVLPTVTYSTVSIIFAITLVENAVGYFIIWNKERKQAKANGWLLVGAILSLVGGFVVSTNILAQFIVESAFLGIVAGYMVSMGVIAIIISFKIKKQINDNKWLGVLLSGILMIVAGIMSFLNPVILAISLGINMAVNIFLTGVGIITSAFAYDYKPDASIKKIKDELEDAKEVIKNKKEDDKK